MHASTRQFFQALYEGVGAGFIEIRPLLDDEDPRKNTDEGKRLQWNARHWYSWPKELENCLKLCETLNGKDFHVYFGVALRKNNREGDKKSVGCCTVVFCDVDFKDVRPETARKLIHEFPHKPSIIVKSGNGLHVYWLLKEPVLESGFRRLEGVNRAMLKYFGAQAGPQDVSRILRVPGTLNIKKKYPDPKPVTEICYWHPEKRYTLDDFEQYVTVELAPEQAPHVPLVPGAPAAAAGPTKKPVPTHDLPDKWIQKCADLVSAVWFDGTRHFLALHIAGWCAHSEYSEATAHKLIAAICAKANDGQLEDRQKAVSDTYRKYLADEKVAGLPALDKLIEDSMPKGLTADEYKETLEKRLRKIKEIIKILREDMPKVKKKEPGSRSGKSTLPNFRIVKILKFNSIPAHFRVTIEKDGADHVFVGDTDTFFKYAAFQKAVYEQHDVVVNDIKEPAWHDIISFHKAEQREAPKEARPEGAIDRALEEFLQEAKENPDLGLLRSFPGYDEAATFFKFEAFNDFLQENGKRFNETKLFDRLKALGWESKVRRFGKKTPHVWTKATGPNGNGNGHQEAPPVPVPPAPAGPVEADLFPKAEPPAPPAEGGQEGRP